MCLRLEYDKIRERIPQDAFGFYICSFASRFFEAGMEGFHSLVVRAFCKPYTRIFDKNGLP